MFSRKTAIPSDGQKTTPKVKFSENEDPFTFKPPPFGYELRSRSDKYGLDNPIFGPRSWTREHGGEEPKEESKTPESRPSSPQQDSTESEHSSPNKEANTSTTMVETQKSRTSPKSASTTPERRESLDDSMMNASRIASILNDPDTDDEFTQDPNVALLKLKEKHDDLEYDYHKAQIELDHLRESRADIDALRKDYHHAREEIRRLRSAQQAAVDDVFRCEQDRQATITQLHNKVDAANRQRDHGVNEALKREEELYMITRQHGDKSPEAPSHCSIRVKDSAPKPDKFDGSEGSSMNFLSAFEQYAADVNWSNERKRTAFSLYFKDSAHTWFRGLEDDQKDTWDKLRKAFIKRYCDPDNKWFNMTKLIARKVKAKTDIEKYIDTFLKDAKENDVSEDMKLSIFIGGLIESPKLLEWVTRGQPKTSADAIALARQGARMFQITKNQQGDEALTTISEGLEDVKKTLNAITTTFSSKPDYNPGNSTPLDYSAPRTDFCSKCKQVGHTFISCPHVDCHRCGRFGHIKANCYSRLGPNNFRSIQNYTPSKYIPNQNNFRRPLPPQNNFRRFTPPQNNYRRTDPIPDISHRQNRSEGQFPQRRQFDRRPINQRPNGRPE